ncbi:MAG TPA: hypothetical protein VEL11_16125 [Candidatus Bathyarchaeia archaeon]|nr:hypothetical protein [Candidatus Bathyarchaeia archaeon]
MTTKMQRVLISLSIVIVVSFLLFPNPVLLAHTFSENENALFLTLINKIKAESQLVAHDVSNNTEQAQDHAKAAEELFLQQDPVVNTTWTKEISERNPRVTADLLHSLNDLKTTIASSPSNSNSTSVQSKVANIGNLLDEAISVRISKDLIDNPKTQALVVANFGNEIYNNYGAALGLPPSTVANMGGMSMAGMSMPSKGSSMNMNASSGNGMSETAITNAMNQSPATIKNLTAYQTAESLAAVAQQVFEKNLKPIAPANATNYNSNIANYLDQLKNAVKDKSSFMNVMELVHGKLHPTLITAYNLRLSMPGMSMPGMSMPGSKGSSMNMNTSSGSGMSGMTMPSKGSSMNMNKQ